MNGWQARKGGMAGLHYPGPITPTGNDTPWNSQPMAAFPYVVAGFAVMSMLVMFALFMLTCSWMRREDMARDNIDPADAQGAAADGLEAAQHQPLPLVDRNTIAHNLPHEEENTVDPLVVIMAGEQAPTHIARPTTSPGRQRFEFRKHKAEDDLNF